MSPTERSASDLVSLLDVGETSSREVTEAFCDRIEAIDEEIGAYLRFDRGAALEQAESIDRRRAAGEPVGKLAGLPVAVKDILCVKGVETTCASRILSGFVPPYDAHVISRLRDEGAVLLGRLNMDEFAMGSSTENSGYRLTRNPWDPERVPGGSSGGSAAAVAASEAPLTIGTDTGGSIRQPAAYCGVVGLKPTYGRVSRYGLIAFASSLDQVGPLARTVEDAALLLQVIAGHDSRDSTCVERDVPAYAASLDEPFDGLRLGLADEFFGEGLDTEVESAVREAIGELEKQGAKVRRVSLPHSRYAVATYYLVCTAEASSNLARYDGVHYGWRAESFDGLVDMYSATRGKGLGAEVKRRIMLGTFALSAGYRDAYYVRALKVRRLIKRDFDEAFKEVDAVIGPVTPTAAFRIGEKIDDPLAMYLQDVYTAGANLAGLPALSLPCGFTRSGLPIGLHLQGAPFAEQTLLRIGRMYQRATDWHERRPAP